MLACCLLLVWFVLLSQHKLISQVAAEPHNLNLDKIAEYGSIERHADRATLVAGGSDAAAQVASVLRDELGLAVSSERPFQMYLGDLLDTTDPTWATAHPDPASRVYAGKPAKVQVDFVISKDGGATDPEALLGAVVAQLNAQLPYGYAVVKVVRRHFTMYALVPNANHDDTGQIVHPQPYMDTPVTIFPQTATLADFAVQMTNQLTVRTGYHFSCCQAAIFGIPWGSGKWQYSAVNKPAREVLADLMDQAGGGVQAYSAACEPRSYDFCFIQVESIRGPGSSEETPAPPRGGMPGSAR